MCHGLFCLAALLSVRRYVLSACLAFAELAAFLTGWRKQKLSMCVPFGACVESVWAGARVCVDVGAVPVSGARR